MKDRSQTRIEKLQRWIRLRKKTTPVHWLIGIVCTATSTQFFWAGVALLVIFAGDELWDDWAHGTKEGEMDWWEAAIVFGITYLIALSLHLAGIISIRWI